MAERWDGKEIAQDLRQNLRTRVEELARQEVTPCLTILRLGEEPGDLAYERGALKCAASVGVQVRCSVHPRDLSEEALLSILAEINQDPTVHGALLLRPFPQQIDDQRVRNSLLAAKDVDGITDGSLAGVFTNTSIGYAPCTAEACLAALDHHGVSLQGKRVVVIGRSLVIGRPVAMMMLHRHATVTLCHTRTVDLAATARQAEILVAAAGAAGMITEEFCAPGQILLDVGMNVDPAGRLCGDVAEGATDQVAAFTPVPGGIGSITSTILMEHVVRAAEQRL